MKVAFFKTAVWQLIMHVDFVSKLILLGLFMLSVFCVAIVIFKLVNMQRDKRDLQDVLGRMKRVRTINDVIAISKDHHDSVGGRFLHHNLTDLKLVLDQGGADAGKAQLATKDLEQLGTMVSQSVDVVVMEQEQYLPVLSTSAAVAPLVGLFGTIWGLIHAFVDIAQERSADITTVAPGMAEALTTTLAGLIVAIPAMIAFHYFANELRKMEFYLVQIADRFLNVATKAFLK
ncbi:MAG: MotA/TolQ/ExbB proton channel family protein [Epsilonproteobacteria bacterium]|nr:MotA/TolQ/ExbB proton channel family protein [Campylobacterota bacterium]